MANTALTLVPQKKKRRIFKVLIPIIFILLLALLAWYLAREYSIEAIEISGTDTYSDAEVVRAMQASDYVPNTLVMVLENRIFGQTYLPFVQKMTMSWDKPHVLKVHVKERLRAGVFEYMKKYVYFNEKGIAMESRNHLFDGVPVVTGLRYDRMVLGDRIPVKEEYFRDIVLISKKIAAYELDVSEIHFDENDEITLTCGDYKIYLGDNTDLEDKMTKISSVLEAVSKEHKKGTIDMHLFESGKEIITFHK